ncbi:uncharacterized protein LOC125600714 [Brassica napus]|uniref:uncharacterized protein LOC125600714 n=1 Tax=Brassica napus TaxID=3708 RepID=UPI0020786B44|nr:uncharacterized protein LOC125600714 [Brassica napus]
MLLSVTSRREDPFGRELSSTSIQAPQLTGSVPREWSQCKPRWGRVNEQVCKFVGSYEAALKEQSSGQNENDVMKAATDIFFNDYHCQVCHGTLLEGTEIYQKWKSYSKTRDAWKEKRKENEEVTGIVIMSGSRVAMSDVAGSTKKWSRKVRPICTSKMHFSDTNVGIWKAGDANDEYLRLAASTALLCLENFTDAIILLFGGEYLRRPTPEDLQRLLDAGRGTRVSDMIGSIDCMHWEWKNCPTA